MIRRPRIALVSAMAVAVSMLLGSTARAANPPAPPNNYYRFLMGLPEARTGITLMQMNNAIARNINFLQHVPMPGPQILNRVAILYSQQSRVFGNIQSNINALLASRATLQGKYQALGFQKESLLAAGRVFRAQQVAMQQGNTSNVLNSLEKLIATERGVATPVR